MFLRFIPVAVPDVFFNQGIGLVWESYKLDPYVQRLAEAVFNYQEKVCSRITLKALTEVNRRWYKCFTPLIVKGFYRSLMN